MHNLTQLNVRAWEIRTPVHVESAFYDVPGFLAGASTLKELERTLCADVRNQRLLHLQCHFGLDTLSWARLGAHAVGVDFSPTAIGTARRIAREIGSDAQFCVGDVLALQGRFEEPFDLAVSSYGALCWLPSLERWARSVASCLRPRGRLVVVEFHPMLDVLFDGCISGCSDYFNAEPVVSRTVGTYATPDAAIEYTEARWTHSIATFITALVDAGFHIRHFAEHPYCAYAIVPRLELRRDGMWWPPASGVKAPYMFSIVAEAGDAQQRP